MTDDDRRMLQAIIDYCSDRCEAAGRAAGPYPVVADARRRIAYARVMRAARELIGRDGGLDRLFAVENE